MEACSTPDVLHALTLILTTAMEFRVMSFASHIEWSEKQLTYVEQFVGVPELTGGRVRILTVRLKAKGKAPCTLLPGLLASLRKTVALELLTSVSKSLIFSVVERCHGRRFQSSSPRMEVIFYRSFIQCVFNTSIVAGGASNPRERVMRKKKKVPTLRDCLFVWGTTDTKQSQ